MTLGIRQPRVVPLFLLMFIGAPLCVVGQAVRTDRPPAIRGLALNAHFALTSTWSYSYPYPLPNDPTYTPGVDVGHGLGLGLELSYALSPVVSVYAGADVAGEINWESGDNWVSYGAGVQLHWPHARRIRPYGNVGIGRLVILKSQGANTSMAQTIITLGGGVEMYLNRRLALESAIRFAQPLGHSTGQSPAGTPLSLDEPPWALRLGITVHFGS